MYQKILLFSLFLVFTTSCVTEIVDEPIGGQHDVIVDRNKILRTNEVDKNYRYPILVDNKNTIVNLNLLQTPATFTATSGQIGPNAKIRLINQSEKGTFTIHGWLVEEPLNFKWRYLITTPDATTPQFDSQSTQWLSIHPPISQDADRVPLILKAKQYSFIFKRLDVLEYAALSLKSGEQVALWLVAEPTNPAFKIWSNPVKIIIIKP